MTRQAFWPMRQTQRRWWWSARFTGYALACSLLVLASEARGQSSSALADLLPAGLFNYGLPTSVDGDGAWRNSDGGEFTPVRNYLATLAHSDWTLQWMPDSLLFRPYMAGVKEPRLASVWSSEKDFGATWDIALGGRVGVLRYGSDEGAHSEGWQLDLGGAAFPRLDPDGESTPVIAVDFRADVFLTRAIGPWHFRFGYYHLSSHLGDEFMLQNPGAFTRINYTRDALVFGAGYYWTDALRLYGEVGYAAGIGGGAKPWEVQFGIDFSPPHTGLQGSPFAAVNAHLREEVDYGGNLVVQAGWQWRQGANGRTFRFGFQYFNGMSDQYEFFEDYESKVGGGLWFDY